MFEKSQYIAIPYGYENPYSNVKKKLPKNLEDCSETTLRIRTSPDLLVFDEDTADVKLVEIKMFSYDTPIIKRIELYQKYWNDAIIMVVVPKSNVFYAQYVYKLGIKPYCDLKSDFSPIQALFSKMENIDLTEYRNLAIQLIETMKTNANDQREDNNV